MSPLPTANPFWGPTIWMSARLGGSPIVPICLIFGHVAGAAVDDVVAGAVLVVVPALSARLSSDPEEQAAAPSTSPMTRGRWTRRGCIHLIMARDGVATVTWAGSRDRAWSPGPGGQTGRSRRDTRSAPSSRPT